MRIKALVVFFLFCIQVCASQAQPSAQPLQAQPWWQRAVFYEIYPRSFADSNNDGIGDLNGIISKLDYLKELGVDALWIAPCFPSPQVDFGYDVSDYENIDPMYGTLADFDNLIKEARKRGIRILLDLVLNHTSDQHKWFLDSKSSKESKRRDWYIWRDGKNAHEPPNNWTSVFGGSAWQLDPTTNQYYYHMFYKQQPDLNWRNPDVKKAMLDMTRRWYKRGVSGFRLDAVGMLFEDPDLHDNPTKPGLTAYGEQRQDRKYNSDLPEVHDVLRELRQVADEYDAVLVGETWTDDIAALNLYYGKHNDEVQLPMDFLFALIDKLSAVEFRKQIASVNSASGWPTFVISNHDLPRSYDRYGDKKHNDSIAKLMAALYLTLRGTPIMYYGEEIGMRTTVPARKEDVKDPIGLRGWPKEKGRDGSRTPMQWDSSENGGFSKAKPWLPVPASAKTYNVASESRDPDSIFSFYKGILRLRHTREALQSGKYKPLNEKDKRVLAYLREKDDETILVALNMSASEQRFQPDFDVHKYSHPKKLLSHDAELESANVIKLAPFGVFIGELSASKNSKS